MEYYFLFFYRFFVVVNLLGLESSQSEIKNSKIAEIFHRPIREALIFPDPSTMGVRKSFFFFNIHFD